MSPLWGFGYLVYAACYKHVAPLGLNAPVLLSPSGLGDPTPTGLTVRYGITCRPSQPMNLCVLCVVFLAYYASCLSFLPFPFSRFLTLSPLVFLFSRSLVLDIFLYLFSIYLRFVV